MDRFEFRFSPRDVFFTALRRAGADVACNVMGWAALKSAIMHRLEGSPGEEQVWLIAPCVGFFNKSRKEALEYLEEEVSCDRTVHWMELEEDMIKTFSRHAGNDDVTLELSTVLSLYMREISALLNEHLDSLISFRREAADFIYCWGA